MIEKIVEQLNHLTHKNNSDHKCLYSEFREYLLQNEIEKYKMEYLK